MINTLLTRIYKCLPVFLFVAILIQPDALLAEPVAVRYLEGSVHGFLVLRTSEGKVLAAGDLTQAVHGDRVASHLVFRFKDGSLDEETATFSQRGSFRLLSDHHIQKGPQFQTSTDVSIDASTGKVTVRYQDKNEEKVETNHLDLPPDLANGILPQVIKNISPALKESKLSYLAATPKPRIVKLSITPKGEEIFSVAGAHHKSTRFTIKVELGGLAGLIAPLMGKQPADTSVWVAGGEVPEFVKSEGPLYLAGPIWRIEMTIPVWARQ